LIHNKTNWNIHRIGGQFDGIITFTKENKFKFLLVGIVIFLVYGRFLWHSNLLLDTHFYVNDSSTAYNWDIIGRYGGILTKLMSGILEHFRLRIDYNPYFEVLMSGLFTLISCIIFSFTVKGLLKIKNINIIILPILIFVVHPVWIEQIYFIFQILPITVGVTYIMVALNLEFNRVINKKNHLMLFSVPLLILAFATYQLFSVLYPILVCMLFVLYNLRSDLNIKFLDNIKMLMNLIFTFVLSTILNLLILSILPKADYLTEKRKWGIDSFGVILARIKNISQDIFFSKGIYEVFSNTLQISLIILIVVLIFFLFKFQNKILIVLSLGFLNLGPYILLLLLGNYMDLRAQFIIPFTIGGNIIIAMAMIKKTGKSHIPILICGGFILLSQIASTNRIIYTYDKNVEQTDTFAQALIPRIEYEIVDKGVESPTLVLIGQRELSMDSVSRYGEIVTIPTFGSPLIAPYQYLFSSKHTIQTLNALMATEIKKPTAEEVMMARSEARNMPIYPMEDSVKTIGDNIIIVKVSEDLTYEEDVKFLLENK